MLNTIKSMMNKKIKYYQPNIGHQPLDKLDTTNDSIQCLWIGEELSILEQLCISSFIYHGHTVHLYTYGNVKNIPDGTIIKDANDIILEKDIFYAHNNSLGYFSDWFRWELLKKKGGYWVDMDIICLKPFNFSDDYVYGFEDNKIIGSALLKFPANSEITHMLSAVCANPNLILPSDNSDDINRKKKRIHQNQDKEHTGWGEAGGPTGLTKALEYFDLKHYAKPFTYFYPIHYSLWNTVFDETLKDDGQLFAHTYAIHLWNEMGRNVDFDKNATFPKDSLIEQLKCKYL